MRVMPGYKVDLYKYMRIDENLKKSQKLLQNRYCVVDENRKDREPDCTFLAFGEFDRIGFEKIERFSRYRDVSLSARTWIGDRQTLLTYEIDGDYSIKYENGNFFHKVMEEDNSWKKSEHLFVGMTVFQFKYSQKKISDDNRGEYLKNCKKNIMSLLQESGLDIWCNVLGILGSFGLVVIYLADQYTDILELITRIRSRDIGKNVSEEESGEPVNSIFLSAYTIFAQNHENGAEWHSKINNIKGETILQMTLKKGLDVNAFQSFFSENGIKKIVLHSAGEYDLIATMKSSNSFGICEMEKDLHYGNELFKTYILQTNMQLCEEKKLADHCDVKLSECAELENQEDSLQDLEKIQHLCKMIREDYAEKFPPTAGMIDTLDLLYNDYISKISTASNEMWVQDFSYQFCSILQCIKKLMDGIHQTKCNILDVIHHLLQYFERQISHIAESNNLTLGTPTCQFRYSGQNNLTLYAYFGIMKHIIEHIYTLQEVNMQSEIIPMIVVDNTPLITSEIYYVNDIKNDPRILTIHMPMTALYFPIAYYPYLYHELFHFVVPKDRYMRNRIIGCLISSEVLLSILKQIFEGVFEKESNQTEWLTDFLIECVLPYIYSFVLSHYFLFEQYEQDLAAADILNQEMDQRSDVSAGYEERLFRKWKDWCNEECDVALKKNPVFGFLEYIYECMDQLKKDAVEWKKSRQQDLLIDFENDIEEFQEQLRGIVKNPASEKQDEKYNELMRYMTETPFKMAMVFNDSIREALADIAMVIMTGMDFSQYLLMYTRIRKDLKISDEEKKKMYSQDNIRIGLVCDYLYRSSSNRDCHMGRIMQMREPYVNMVSC